MDIKILNELPRVKITYSNKTVTEVLEDFPDFLGNGAYRYAYASKDGSKVIKVPSYHGENEPYYSRSDNSDYCDYDDEEEWEVQKLDWAEKIERPYFFQKDNGEYSCSINIECESMWDNIAEVLFYENCIDKLRYILCPVLEIIFTNNNIPLVIFKRCTNTFSGFLCEEEGNSYNTNENIKRDTSHRLYKSNEGKSKKKSIKLKDLENTPIDVLGAYLKKSKKEIKKIKKDYECVTDFFQLSLQEQLDNWGNIGYCETGEIYMMDYN